MKIQSAIGLVLLSSLSFAHEDHDWREDYMAYLSIEYVMPTGPFALKSKSVKTTVGKLDMNFFQEKLKVLTGVTPYISNGTSVEIKERKTQESLNHARAFLAEEYKQIGFAVEEHPFSTGINFIAEKKGTTNPEKVLILSSHIDSVANSGANDNGTGTIGLLTIARELAKSEYGATIRILGFDHEELGLRGSDAYVATIENRDNIIGNINFEMMGVNSRNDGAFHVIDCNKKNSLFLSNAIKDSIATHSLELSIVNTCTDRSDHASFWRRNIPAIVISENFFGGDSDPCYHEKCDVMDERLNYDYMEKILTAVLDATKNLAK